jgi:DNA-binding response OmpR family regulator
LFFTTYLYLAILQNTIFPLLKKMSSNFIATVLICEDDDIMMTILHHQFKMLKINYVHCPDGKAGYEYLKHSSANIDLLISDILMPEMTGLELVDAVRREMKLKLPILIISAVEQNNISEEALDMGANDFIAKPFRPDEIALRIRRLLKSHYPERFNIL